MVGWLLIAAYVAESASLSNVPAIEPATQPVRIDILLRHPSNSCDGQVAEEIVVCAQKTGNESQRLRPIANAPIYTESTSKAEFGVSENVLVAAEAESNQLGAGIVNKAILARLKFKF